MAYQYVSGVTSNNRPYSALVLGQTLFGTQHTYEVQRYVNFDPATRTLSSGQAIVYQARVVGTNRLVAIKQMLTPKDARARERHERECTFLLGGPGHPNIVKGIERITDGIHEFVIMEWVKGKTLYEAMKSRLQVGKGPFTEKDALRILRKMTAAVRHTNQRGYYCRDGNECNFLLSGQREDQITMIDLAGIEPINLNRPTDIFTPSTPPENYKARMQNQGARSTLQTEVYMIGAIGYFLLTGILVPEDRASQPLDAIRKHNPNVSVELERLVTNMVAIDPKQRPATPTAVEQELSRLMGVAVSPLPVAPRAPMPPVIPGPPAGLPVVPMPPTPRKRLAAPPVLHRVQTHPDFQRVCGPALRLSAVVICAGLLPLLFPIFSNTTERTPAHPAHPPVVTAPGGSSRTASHPPAPIRAAILGTAVRVRSKPGLSGKVIGQIGSPQQVSVVACRAGWAQVRTPSGSGYVWAAYLRCPGPWKRGKVRGPVSLSDGRLATGERVLFSVSGQKALIHLPTGQTIPVSVRLILPDPQ